MKTIGLCITELEPGGAERAFVQLAIRVNRSGRFRVVVYILGEPPQNPVLANQLIQNQISIRYLNLNAENKGSLPGRLSTAFRNYRQYLVQDQVDAVQSFLFHANVLSRLATWGIRSISGKPILTFSGYRVSEPRRWQNILDRFTRFRDTAAVAVSESVARYYFPDDFREQTPETEQVPETEQNPEAIPTSKSSQASPKDQPPKEQNNKNISGEIGSENDCRKGGKNREKACGSGKTARWMSVITNGVDADYFCPDKRARRPEILAELGAPPDSSLILSIGRLTEQKNFAFLIRETAPLLKKNPNYYLAIAGEGEERGRLSNLIQTVGLENRVLLCGYYSQNDYLLAAADLFVLTSRWEGLPNVALEAAATGLPILALSTAGVAPIVGDSGFTATDLINSELNESLEPDFPQKTAIRDSSEQIRDSSEQIRDSSEQIIEVNFNTPKNGETLESRFRDRISAFLYDPEYAQKVGRRNRQRVINHFNWDKMAESYENLWQKRLNLQTPLDNNPNNR